MKLSIPFICEALALLAFARHALRIADRRAALQRHAKPRSRQRP